jgi:dTDP-4-dehydrorhamnose 3,5-epimerase
MTLGSTYPKIVAKITPSSIIDGIVVIEPDIHGDDRGFFVETYRRQWFPGGREMLQGNRGDRKAGAIVGLHYHLHQADYWYVPFGACRVVLHDLRQGSPTDGATETVDLGTQSDGSFSHNGVYIPPGIAHGFAALSDMTITYLVDGYYNPADENGVAWNDPAVDADWGIVEPVLSERDQQNPLRSNIEPMWQPHYSLRTG